MDFRKHINPIAGGVGAALVTLVVLDPASAFVIAWLTERGVYANPGDRVAAALEWLGDFTGQPWFIFLAGASVGLAVGIWVDGFLRGRPTASGSQQWLTVLEARGRFLGQLDPEIAEATETAKELDIAKWAAEWEVDLHPDEPGWRDAAVRAETVWVKEQSRLERLQIAARDEIVRQLASGQLIARGLPMVDGKAQTEGVVPQEFWRFLTLDWTVDSAHGQGHNFVGLRLSRSDGSDRLV